MKRIFIGVALATSTWALQAQWSDFGNTAVIPGTNFLGSINNARLDVITNDIRRFTLLPDATYTIGSFPSQVRDGCLLLSPDVDQFYFNGAPGPFSLLHLAAADDNAQVTSFRDWMNTGVTMTGNADQNYMGQKATGFDTTDMVIHWSDNPGKALKDRMRFLFTSGYNAAATTGAGRSCPTNSGKQMNTN